MKKHNHDFVYRFQATENINSRLACVKCGITLEEFIEKREKEAVVKALGKVRLEKIEHRKPHIIQTKAEFNKNRGFNYASDKLETLKKRILEEL